MPDTPTPPKRNNLWRWFFAFLVVASVGVAGFMIWFNRHIQLTPEQLEAAMARWKEHGPRDYRLTYTRQLNDDTHVDRFVSTVRGGKVVEVEMNGLPLLDHETGEPLRDERLQYHSMERLLRFAEKFMEMDTKKEAPAVYVVAFFDEKTGALSSYVRRVMGKRERVKLEARLEPLP